MKRIAIGTSVLALVLSAAPVAESAADPLISQAQRHRIGREIARECGPIASFGRVCLLGYVRTRAQLRLANVRIVLARQKAASAAERSAWVLILRSEAAKWLAEIATIGRLRPPVMHWADGGRTLIYDRDLVPK